MTGHSASFAKRSSTSGNIKLAAVQVVGDVRAFLVDLMSNKKLPIVSPDCKVGCGDDCDVRLKQSELTAGHIAITEVDGAFFVEDRESQPQALVNGRKIVSREQVKDGDVLKIGSSLFWFSVD